MKLIKVCKNGTRVYEEVTRCDRCGGTGNYIWGAIINGCPQYMGTCFKCNGSGKVIRQKKVFTPEHQAELDAKREAKWAKNRAIFEENERRVKEAEERRIAEEKARKAISQYVGNVGDKIEIEVTYTCRPSYERKSFSGYGTDTVHVHTFTDDNGNVLVWKTTARIAKEIGDKFTIKAVVKDHDEYNEQKQTVLKNVRTA